MCAQLVVYPQRRPIFSTTQLGWLPVPYYTQQVLSSCSTHRRPGRPPDSLPMWGPARPGQSERGLGFGDQAFVKPDRT